MDDKRRNTYVEAKSLLEPRHLPDFWSSEFQNLSSDKHPASKILNLNSDAELEHGLDYVN